jgi:hypothetical protein
MQKCVHGLPKTQTAVAKNHSNAIFAADNAPNFRACSRWASQHAIERPVTFTVFIYSIACGARIQAYGNTAFGIPLPVGPLVSRTLASAWGDARSSSALLVIANTGFAKELLQLMRYSFAFRLDRRHPIEEPADVVGKIMVTVLGQ